MEKTSEGNRPVGSMIGVVPSGSNRPVRQLVLVVGIAKDKRERLLLIRRYEPGSSELHNRWELPGGKVEFGEDPVDAVQREIVEETGVKVSVRRMLPHVLSFIRRSQQGRIHVLILCYLCDVLRLPRTPHCPPKKISAIRWASGDHLDTLDLQKGTRLFLRFVRLS